MAGVHDYQVSSEITKRFFQFVKEEVVLAVVKSELGDVQVGTLLDLLASWTVDDLVDHMNVIIHSWGFFGDYGHSRIDQVYHQLARYPPPYQRFPPFENIWGVTEVRSAVGVEGPPLNVFIGLAVGKEGWCVLTPHSAHFLIDHNGSTSLSPIRMKC